jgi:hypothetical protein
MRRRRSFVRMGVTFLCLTVPGVGSSTPAADVHIPTLACGKVVPQLDRILSQEPVGAVTVLRPQLLACFESHKICGVVYDHTQPLAHVFSGESSSDVPSIEWSDRGASYALMAARSLPPSRKSGAAYCLALTPGEHADRGPFDWHGWQVSMGGEVSALDLSGEPSSGIQTNPRSLATTLWNYYTSRF